MTKKDKLENTIMMCIDLDTGQYLKRENTEIKAGAIEDLIIDLEKMTSQMINLCRQLYEEEELKNEGLD
ncbi:hypothetical protein vipetofem_34 [Enterococcus phage vipetofem]|uniref:Uncharacterized protein n=1 Tax=Enterococcus phage vipetofem TaxID=2719594 RepID=A0A6G9LP83_9CAUD|nr:hypothetical protein KNU92_gp106 [Enterococcus phage vipetofem]QIQ66332.1 hypothetical protein vipetofem_34 [Enterococcus phage vipetofem]SCO93480.1 hypothetical protein [Enterococcus phage VPE25]SCZ84045.1 hypothetical protein [Enterococcus phage VFW]